MRLEMQTLLAPIVQVCDAISGARPGARREIVEAYIKRLNDLEQLALSYPGVVKTYAIQAGRELRVIVGADKIDDKDTENLSNEIAKEDTGRNDLSGAGKDYGYPRNPCCKLCEIKSFRIYLKLRFKVAGLKRSAIFCWLKLLIIRLSGIYIRVM